jgi:hypothetical protein
LDALSEHFFIVVKQVINCAFILKLQRQTRAVPSVSKELFEESREETQKKVMSMFVNNKM